MNMKKFFISVCVILMTVAALPSYSELLVEWNFTTGTHGWTGNAEVVGLQSTAEGLDFTTTGGDPWIEVGPSNYSTSRPVRVTIRMRSNADAGAQLFYGSGFTEPQSARFVVQNDGGFHDYVLEIPPLGNNARLRLDPAHSNGQITVAWIRLEALDGIETVATWAFVNNVLGWSAQSNITGLAIGAEGLQFTTTGSPAVLQGPATNYTSTKPMTIHFHLRSSVAGEGRIYYGNSQSEANSVPFAVQGENAWIQYSVGIPALNGSNRIWLKLADTPGALTLKWLRVDAPIQNQQVVFWDFTQGTFGWTGNPRVANLVSNSNGLDFDVTGEDPWLTSPAVTFPSDKGLIITFRMRSNADTSGQLFYGRTSFAESRSVRFAVSPDNEWHEYTLFLPAMGTNNRLRLDPSHNQGHITIAWMKIETLIPIQAANLVPPEHPVDEGGDNFQVTSESLAVEHFGRYFGDYVVRIGDQEMASGHTADQVNLVQEGVATWFSLKNLPVSVVPMATAGFVEQVTLTQPGLGNVQISRSFMPGSIPGVIEVRMQLRTEQPIPFYHIPWMTLFPGLGTFGSEKQQGLFAGLEYLANEPSSSTKDLTVAEYNRLIPDPVKITFPLMAITQNDCCLGLAWRPSDQAAAIHDTPDRVFNSNAHLMALWAPAVGAGRQENAITPSTPIQVQANTPLVMEMAFLGGKGGSVVPAVRKYVEKQGLPPIPQVDGGYDEAMRTLGAGWIDSDAYDSTRSYWRHAVWPGFDYQVASDAPVFMTWLANNMTDETLAGRLRVEIGQAILRRFSDDPTFSSGVSHVYPPIGGLMLGNTFQYMSQRRSAASAALGTFNAQGIQIYTPVSGRPDYSTTHYENHANGYGGNNLYAILLGASISGDQTLINNALSLLDKTTQVYRNTVPRGAQTWEIPLHTPDILASAHLARAYVIGYELTGRQDLLEEARYWGWTGVPFVYLHPPTTGATGLYATIAVLGATNWQAPVWIGQPVQWCGLVYADALYRLAKSDPQGPWLQIAKGITGCGLRMTWPRSDTSRQGLLPDFFHLKIQVSDGPAINPGTVQAHVPEYFDLDPMYDFKLLPRRKWYVHAATPISEIHETRRGARFQVKGWGMNTVHRVFISNVPNRPSTVLFTLNTQKGEKGTPVTFSHDAVSRYLVIQLTGGGEVEVVVNPDLSEESSVWRIE